MDQTINLQGLDKALNPIVAAQLTCAIYLKFLLAQLQGTRPTEDDSAIKEVMTTFTATWKVLDEAYDRQQHQKPPSE